MRRLLRVLILPLLLLAPAGGAAQELADYDYVNLSFRGLGFDVGMIWPDKVKATPVWSLRLDLGFLGPAIRIVPSLSYWSSTMRTAELERLAERLSLIPSLQEREVVITAADMGRIAWSDLSLGVDAHVVWTAPLDIITFVGAGTSVHALNGRGDFIDDTFIEDLLDSTTAGLAVMAGFEVQPLARVRVYGEARYTLVSNVRYPGLRIGAALMLPPRQ
jgi:hypothetical protein